jgi:hypothetical protein
MAEEFNNSNTRIGTLGGTMVVLIFQVDMSEILHTALLAAVGATASFGISVLLKFLFQKFRKN